MKEIKAIIQPGKLEKVRMALTALPEFPGMTVMHVQGCGPTLDKVSLDIRAELTDFSPKVFLSILAPDELIDTLVRIIHQTAHTGQIGDGIVWVTAADHFVRIKNPPCPPSP